MLRNDGDVHLLLIHPQETVFIAFSKEERVIYRILEDRFRSNINMHFKKGTAAGNYSNFMVQLLRLRQATARK
jgi:hypothetical protein